MKRLLIEILQLGVIGFLLCFVGSADLMAQATETIQQVRLNPLAVAGIPVSLKGPTTIRFPSPISDLEGAFISTDPNSSALFLLSFRPGSAFFSVRALVANANTSLNVVWRNQTYVIELRESKAPCLSVIFTESPIATASARHEPVLPSRLLGLLDTAKALPLLKTEHPEAVAGVQAVRPNTVNDYGDYTIKTEEIVRFDDADTLVFRISVSNKTALTMHYHPQSIMVQAGNRVFYQSITDGNGEIPPQAAVPIYFAITGAAEGGRGEISPRNDFLILLHRIETPEANASHSSLLTNQPTNGFMPSSQKTVPPPPATVALPDPLIESTQPKPMTLGNVSSSSLPTGGSIQNPAPQPSTLAAGPYHYCSLTQTYYHYAPTRTYSYYPASRVYYYYPVFRQSNDGASTPGYWSVPVPVFYSLVPCSSPYQTQPPTPSLENGYAR